MKHSPDFSSRFRILKGGKISLVVSALLAGVSLLHAAPSGGVVTSGTANIAQSGSVTTINQSSQKASINWQNFSIGKSETVNFNQPSVSAITLNRVVGNEKSIIEGALNANGQVWILNSNGVLFNSSAKVNTAGLLATTKALSDEDFQKGEYSFKGDSSASVINLGEITINNGGYATMLANTVQNEGTIKAIHGTVHLTGASEATINLNGNSLVSLKVDKGVLDALVENKGAIYADGGNVYLTTNAVNELLKGVVNNTGLLEANSLEDITGEIILFAHGGALHVNGTIEAKDGFVETSGKTLHVEDSTIIKTKKWLIDPDNITIESSGGASLTGDSVSATAIQNALSSADIELQATNDITVNENIIWATATQLKLTAGDEIYVNATIENTNITNGGVYFKAANVRDKVVFGTDGKVIIHNVNQLQWINQALNGKYALGGNINASATASWDSDSGFVPIGDDTDKFSGTFDGQGYVIDALTIKRPMTDNVGLFGAINTDAMVQNIGLTNVNITGQSFLGGLAGSNFGTIFNSYATGTISGTGNVGGLVGYNQGTISNSYATGIVSGGGQNVGGLVGHHRQGSITNAYATSNMSGGGQYVGGLVGWIYDGTITNVYATGEVGGTSFVGGLVGYIQKGSTASTSITNAYATGDVTGSLRIGGLVGHATGASITNVYATGDVSGIQWVGGLVGFLYNGTITNAYATGSVPSTGTIVGGFVGENQGTIAASFWDTTSSGTTTGVGAGTSTGVTGKTTAQMQDPLLYANAMWDTTVWAYGSGVAGYGIGLAYLKNVTAISDRPAQTTLFAGGFGTSATPYTITNWTQLQNINYNTAILSKYFTLLNNLNSATAGYTTIASSTANSGAGFVPIGNNSNKFSGSFDGQGHTISDLYINRPTMDLVGLFGFSDGATIRNIGIVNANITGNELTSGLVGYAFTGTTITNAYTAGGRVTGSNNSVGGLAGAIDGSTITSSYATADVISGGNDVGGLVGAAYQTSTITNSYATGSVKGNGAVGGLVGQLYQSSTITNSYATGLVTGNTFAGGLVGSFSSGGAVTNSYWDNKTSGQPTSARGVGKTTEEMKTLSTYTGWNITGADGAYPTLTLGTGANAAYTWQMIHPVTPTPTPTPTPNNPAQTPDVTAIVNGTAITPPILPNFTPLTPPTQAPVQLSANGATVQLASIPSGDSPSQLVGTQEARVMMQGEAGGDLRVPLGQNSLIQLINGGVRLPEGLEQQFFMAQN